MKKFLILLLVLSTACFSQQEKYNQLDSLFSILESKNKTMGSIAVMENGKMEYTNAIGFQFKTENGQKEATETSKYRIGSVTKIFTATMIFQLIDENKLFLNDKLSKFYPEIPNASKISIANLLNHSSGLFNVAEEPDFHEWMVRPSSQEKMLDRIKSHKVNFESGEKNAYSNTNYILLGYILESIEGKLYGDILKDKIADKLNLENTYYGGAIDIESGECQSYYIKKGKLKQARETHISNPAGAGAIVSNTTDMVIFINALFNDELISPNSFEAMTGLSKDPYCSGIMFMKKGEQTIYGHGGAIDGFQAFLLYAPETKTAVAVTSNATKYATQAMVFHALDASEGKTFQMPNFNRIELSEEEVKRYEGIYENSEFPFDLFFVAKGKTLRAGPNAEQLNNLVATKKDEFSFESMGVTLKFDLENNTVLFNDQTSAPKVFTKKQ
ncbi:serine hydrolase domain-containing protein [Hyunsoonleella rubra]|uniref:Serine hydrolase domain-containing protein n=1 Tax=Hyunsoonleella rubra TaxID=1737062 RepID=A0ABW5TAM1_9FLAO